MCSCAEDLPIPALGLHQVSVLYVDTEAAVRGLQQTKNHVRILFSNNCVFAQQRVLLAWREFFKKQPIRFFKPASYHCQCLRRLPCCFRHCCTVAVGIAKTNDMTKGFVEAKVEAICVI